MNPHDAMKQILTTAQKQGVQSTSGGLHSIAQTHGPLQQQYDNDHKQLAHRNPNCLPRIQHEEGSLHGRGTESREFEGRR